MVVSLAGKGAFYSLAKPRNLREKITGKSYMVAKSSTEWFKDGQSKTALNNKPAPSVQGRAQVTISSARAGLRYGSDESLKPSF